MPDCACYRPPFSHVDYVSTPLGVDKTYGRYGDVSIHTCVHCKTKWLLYYVEYEAFTTSGRWFKGRISDAQIASLMPEHAVQFLEGLPWYFKGGSYFCTAGERASGAVGADL